MRPDLMAGRGGLRDYPLLLGVVHSDFDWFAS